MDGLSFPDLPKTFARPDRPSAPFAATTFNVRVGHAPDGENAWPRRRPLVEGFLKEGGRALWGFQEVLPEVAAELSAMLGPDFVCLGRGREADGSGEQVMMAVDRRRFEVGPFGHFMLSPTPLVPGSRYEFSGKHVRICTWAALTDRQSGGEFLFFNTHLDHQSLRAAEEGLKLILGQIRRAGRPALLSGDFNAGPELVAKWTEGLSDASDLPPGTFTYHAYGRDALKIDYLFCTSDFCFAEPQLDRMTEGGVWLSDHFPLTNEFRFRSE